MTSSLTSGKPTPGPQVSGAGSRERQLQGEAAAARAEVTRLKAELGGAQRAEAESVQLRSQLAAAQAAVATARAEADRARVDAQGAEARVAQLQSQLGAAEAAGRDAAALRSQLADAQRAADEARLAVLRTAGEKDEERAVANRTLRVGGLVMQPCRAKTRGWRALFWTAARPSTAANVTPCGRRGQPLHSTDPPACPSFAGRGAGTGSRAV
jgi:chromosome segregation ATPase